MESNNNHLNEVTDQLSNIIKKEHDDSSSYNDFQTDFYTNLDKTGIQIENLYENHVIKEELVIGPETIQESLNYINATITEIDKNILGFQSKCDVENNKSANVKECDICGKSFVSTGNLARHMSIVHDGVKPYTCKECGKKFKHRDVLNTHIKRYHSYFFLSLQNKSYSCSECGKKFANKNIMKKHLNSKHTVIGSQLQYLCQFCNKSLICWKTLGQHERFTCEMNPNKDSKCFICDYCNKSYKRKETVEKHINKHLGIRLLYQCDVCKKLYTRKINLKRHILIHHMYKKNTISCDKCEKTFFSRWGYLCHKKKENH